MYPSGPAPDYFLINFYHFLHSGLIFCLFSLLFDYPQEKKEGETATERLQLFPTHSGPPVLSRFSFLREETLFLDSKSFRQTFTTGTTDKSMNLEKEKLQKHSINTVETPNKGL